MLHLHRAARADVLIDALSGILATAPADPLAGDLVSVPTRGMERWLTQRLAHSLGSAAGADDGICAAVSFPTPHRLLAETVALAGGIDPDTDPWRPERLTWPLLEVVQASLGEPWLGTLAAYLGEGGDPVRAARRLSIVRHLAELFDRYALHRPAMLEAWRRGEAGGAAGDGGLWQAELWRRLRQRLALAGPAERLTTACERLRETPGCVELPARLSLFGITRLPAGHLQVLRALAVHRDVHLLLLHASGALWERIAAAGPAAVPPRLRRGADASGELVHNRLLASWGRDAREMQLVLAASAAPGDSDVETPSGAPPVGAPTLLARLQDDIRADRAAPGRPLPGEPDRRAALAPRDTSLTVHACHGRARQVEVLRDAILHVLADDATLEPRDVIVMCPDIETFAPLIQATFAGPDEAERDAGELTGDLRVRLADRSLTQTNGVLGVVSVLLGLVERRVTASEVLDLADRGPVRRRFRFDDDDLTRLQDWIAQAGIRWGLDAPSRAPYQLGEVADGTWRAGLDRLLLGVAMTEDGARRYGGVLPLDDVDSRSVELAGRAAELVARLRTALAELGRPHTLAGWARVIGTAADALTATPDRERWQRAELQRILEEMVAEGGAGEPAPRVSPREIRAHLAARLGGRPTRANFRTGHLTVCTLMPMRSVPHRVVCLLGLDDGEFPRRSPRDGDDLMLADPQLGERDPRTEDRQLLLDALLAATDRVIITYTGNDERTGAERPPAVPVGELLDAVAATVADRPGDPDGEAGVVVRHPLQPFDPRNFTGARPWGFDPAALHGAQALAGPRGPARRFLDGPLDPPADAEEVELEDLVRFVQRPVRAFLRRRLGISLRDEMDEVDDELPIDLDGLARWGVADRLLEAQLRGTSLRTAAAAEKVRGTLPPGALGDRVIDDVRDLVGRIAQATREMRVDGADRDPIDVRLTLPGGVRLTGTVAGVNDHTLLSVSYSRVAARHRMAAWVRFLALSAAAPEAELCAVTIGRGGGRDTVRVCRIDPLPGPVEERRRRALTELDALVALMAQGMREPLPLFPDTAAAWADARRDGRDPESEARGTWESGYTKWGFREREDAEAAHQYVHGGRLALAELLRVQPRAQETGSGWATDEPTRLGRLARRYWDPLLDAERVSSR